MGMALPLNLEFFQQNFIPTLIVVGLITFGLQKREEDMYKPFINTAWVIGIMWFTKLIFTPQLLTETFSENITF